MSFGGSASAMNTSIKNNANLRKGRASYSKFYKKSTISVVNAQSLTREENLKIIAENKQKLKRRSKIQLYYAIGQLIFYGSIIGYVLYVVL